MFAITPRRFASAEVTLAFQRFTSALEETMRRASCSVKIFRFLAPALERFCECAVPFSARAEQSITPDRINGTTKTRTNPELFIVLPTLHLWRQDSAQSPP